MLPFSRVGSNETILQAAYASARRAMGPDDVYRNVELTLWDTLAQASFALSSAGDYGTVVIIAGRVLFTHYSLSFLRYSLLL